MPVFASFRKRARKLFRIPVVQCHICGRWFTNRSGYTQHKNALHPKPDGDAGEVVLHADDGIQPEGDQNAEGDNDAQLDLDLENMDVDRDQPDAEINEDQRLDLDDNARMGNGTYHENLPRDTSPTDDHQHTPECVRDYQEGQNGSANHGHSEQRRERQYHPVLTGFKCDIYGNFIQRDAPSPARSTSTPSWYPYRSQNEFELADLLFRKNEMPQGQVDQLMSIMAAEAMSKDPAGQPLFANNQDLLDTIDATPNGSVRWKSFKVSYSGPIPNNEETPSWMLQEYDVWYRDAKEVVKTMLSNRDYDGEFHYAPHRDFDERGKRVYKDLMLGDWAWHEADLIAADVSIHSKDCTLVPVILGSDKTTVSVATGQNKYYPLYVSIGGVTNSVRRAHRGAVAVLAFLANPKTDRQHNKSDNYKHFRRQLFHSSLSVILRSLRDAMNNYEVLLCPDGHYRRVIFSLGPYIADYPEQVLVSCVLQGWCARCLSRPENLEDISADRNRRHTDLATEVHTKRDLAKNYGIIKQLVPFTNDFPRADIHELIAPDILHQIIKGSFKDYLVTWVSGTLFVMYPTAKANKILDDIDSRIALAPPFGGLRRFPHGRGFKQWTGDDSKALMKVYLPALVGHLPDEVVLAVRAFLDFCYLVRRSVISDDTLDEIDDALRRFFHYREIFQEMGVRAEGFSVPRLHSVIHYKKLIRYFGAPNGLCSSITESKHIDAVKKPWRRSNRYNALGQMLKTISRLDKLRASRLYFESEGMFQNPFLNITSPNDEEEIEIPDDILNEDDDEAVDGPTVVGCVRLATTPQRGYPRDLEGLSERLSFLGLPYYVRKFLFRRLHPEESGPIPPWFLPKFNASVKVFHSATATFHAPSDPSGVGGMKREQIRATPSWRKGSHRYDTVFVETDPDKPGMRGMHVARVNTPNNLTGMWVVSPEYKDDELSLAVIHVDSILRAAHLLPQFGEGYVADAHELDPLQTLDNFSSFYVNKYIDHHANEIAF